MSKEHQETETTAASKALPISPGSRFDTPETDILHDHCHIDNTPAPEAIETWVDKCKKLERERNALKSALHRLDRIYRQDLDDPGNRPDWLQIHFENNKCEQPTRGE